MNICRKVLPNSSSFLRFRSPVCTPIISARNVGAYQGHGKTTINVMNNKDSESITISAYSQVGFRLHNGIFVVGPMILYKNVALGWDVRDDQAVNEDSLEFFRHLEPPLDLLILGLSEDKSLKSFNRELIIQFRKLGLAMEILPSTRAVQMYNFVAETRNVAGAFVPPRRFNITTEDYFSSTRKFGIMYGPEVGTHGEGNVVKQAREMGIKDS
ncbi:uncharacterized protein LOC135839501 [Planococcus citri]|uniref:uncharacterized protein LOC135839501 n=1 Tax=Planococcus citri TaxID=170843 RepID=UPI0031FA0850